MTEQEAKEAIDVLNELIAIYNTDHFRSALFAAIRAIEKQIPKKPIIDCDMALCPVCNSGFLWNNENYCSTCGQRILWEVMKDGE